jgi:ABC-type antimicrobial peptide transport system permease subunit
VSPIGYAMRELAYRRGRTIVTAASIAVSVATGILLWALATAYSQALHRPVETVGADVIVQMTGDIPPKLEGLVFPHPNALIPANQVAQIRAMPGVVSTTRGVYMWELGGERYQSILGIEAGEAGLDGLNARLVDGKPLHSGDRAVLADSDFATKSGLHPGQKLSVGGESLPVVGVVDAARSGKLIRADVYMPMAVAQALAAAAPQVLALYPFKPDDANLLLVKVDRERLEGVVDTITTLLGKKGIVSSELSFREALSGVMFLSERMGLIIAAIIGAFAAVFILRATASAVQERRREMVVLQAIGWRWNSIRGQVLIENALLAAAGAVIGLVVALVAVAIMGGVSVTIEFPWDLSSTPHFIPDATLDRTQTVVVPVAIPWGAAAIAGAGALVVSLAAALGFLASAPTNPWSALRSE